MHGHPLVTGDSKVRSPAAARPPPEGRTKYRISPETREGMKVIRHPISTSALMVIRFIKISSGVFEGDRNNNQLVIAGQDHRVIRCCMKYQTIPNASPIMPIIHELMVRNPISPRQETAPITGTSAGYCRYSDGILNAAMFAIK